MAQTYETRRRSGKHESSDAKASGPGQAPKTKSRMEKNMSKKNVAPTQKQSQSRESEFKGKPVLGLYRSEGDTYPVRFGLGKAALILAHVEDIKAFQDKHSKQHAPAAA